MKVFKKVKYGSKYYFHENMRKVEIDNVEELLEKTVTKDGKVGGLTKHAGKTILIVVPNERNKK